ncbi:C40 family peptidase [Dysgonomonas sp. Marseille-P4677]|uniref:C40 family peptidase n=1 Tax=Dysgonomonas sp. Marseille-P4677 TaxID=2364790 RepID=UPI001911CA42|nr:C40 family peptidase [Dysgonomonas sp. Marseille-P4677]MBK5719758.1 C40 family peptidase [Dysgonomonas sp. Marseille-P4677]
MLRLIIRIFILSLSVIFLTTSCGSKKLQSGLLYDPKEVAELSEKLGIELSNLNKGDDYNMPLYAEVSQWLGVPYRHAGLSRKGLDCSGFAYLMYQKVYNKKIPRSTSDLARMKMKHVSKKQLQTGDLVFFATSKNRGKISHVGIYLKDGFFIHASTSQGVVVNHLDEPYYSKSWKKGGRI